MSEATEPEITTGAWILGQQAKLRAAEADANQLAVELEALDAIIVKELGAMTGTLTLRGQEIADAITAARKALDKHREVSNE